MHHICVFVHAFRLLPILTQINKTKEEIGVILCVLGDTPVRRGEYRKQTEQWWLTFFLAQGGKLVVGRRAPRPKSGGGGMWWWGGVLGAAAGEGVNTQLPGDSRYSCQIISSRIIGRVIR